MAQLEGNPRAHKSGKYFSILNWWTLKEPNVKRERQKCGAVKEVITTKRRIYEICRPLFILRKAELFYLEGEDFHEAIQNESKFKSGTKLRRREMELKKGNDICTEKNEEREK